MSQLRTNICRVALHTKKKLETLEKSKLATLEKMRMNDIYNIKKAT